VIGGSEPDEGGSAASAVRCSVRWPASQRTNTVTTTTIGGRRARRLRARTPRLRPRLEAKDLDSRVDPCSPAPARAPQSDQNVILEYEENTRQSRSRRPRRSVGSDAGSRLAGPEQLPDDEDDGCQDRR
jgi:hypothetical protein